MTPSLSIVEAAPSACVLGPGLMGVGIAWALGAAGVEVEIRGRDLAAGEAGRQRLAASLARQVARGRMYASVGAAILERVRAGDADAPAPAGCGLVIEALPEDRELKRRMLRRWEDLAPDAILASTTSGLPITGLATGLRRPDRFIGLHFFSPAERMPLVEVVSGRETSEATRRAAVAFVERIGKYALQVRDGPGFFTSRVFAAYLDEAVAMLEEGVSPPLIESAGVANGRAWGPLATLDETGLALNLQQARQAAADGLPDRFRRPLCAPALARLVALGRKGRRDGGGFFDWPAERERVVWPGLAELFPLGRTQPDLERISRRLFVAEALEALRCLEEGVIASADDVDAASVLGLGFPRSRGGILSWVERGGLASLVADAERLAHACGERFAPSPWLRDLAARGLDLKAYRTKESAE